MKGSLKKKLATSRWAGHVERMGDEKLGESRCPESGGEKEVRKTEIVMGDCIKRFVERVGEE